MRPDPQVYDVDAFGFKADDEYLDADFSPTSPKNLPNIFRCIFYIEWVRLIAAAHQNAHRK